MYLEIVTPEKKAFEGEVEAVQVPALEGSFEVLNSHAAIVSALSKGNVRIKTKEGYRSYTIDEGLIEVLNNKVVVLAESISEV